MITSIGNKSMNWIKEIKDEIKGLDVSQKALRNFAFIVGGIFLIFSSLSIFKKSFSLTNSIILGSSVFLIGAGFVSARKLEIIYRLWMGIAFCLGSVVSRFILIVIFYGVLTPLGVTAKLFGKKFIDSDFNQKQDSYWISKNNEVNYEKMY